MMDSKLKYQAALMLAVILLAGCATSGSQKAAQTEENSQPSQQSAEQSSLLYNALVAEMAGHRGNLDEAVRYYHKVTQVSDQPAILRRAARIMAFAKDYEAAGTAVEKWLQLAPDSMEAHQLAATIAIQQKKNKEAAEQLQWMVARSGKQDFTVLAAFLDRLNQPVLVLPALETVLSRYADKVDAQVIYARQAFNAANYDKSRFAARKAIDLQPTHTEAQIIYARSGIESGKVEQSLADLAITVDRYPDNRDLRLNYARLLVTSSRFESAVEQFEVLIKSAPNNADLLYSTALVMLQIKRYTDAEQILIKLTGIAGHQQEARYYLGKLEEERRNFSGALTWYKAVEPGTLYVESQMSAARIQAKQGDVAVARKAYARLRQNHGQSIVKIWLGESEMLREVKQHQAAYDVLDEAVKLNPDDMDLLYSRALAAEKIDRIDILERDMKRVLKNEPRRAHALNALGYTLADRTDRYQEALEYIKQALVLSPTDPAIIDSMGWVLYRMGRKEEALVYLRRALARFHDGEIAAHLGEVLWVSGKQEAALEIWNKALDAYPDSEALLDVMQRFEP